MAASKTEDPTRISKAQCAWTDRPSFQIDSNGFDFWFLRELLRFTNWWEKKIFFSNSCPSYMTPLPLKVNACQPLRGWYWICYLPYTEIGMNFSIHMAVETSILFWNLSSKGQISMVWMMNLNYLFQDGFDKLSTDSECLFALKTCSIWRCRKLAWFS